MKVLLWAWIVGFSALVLFMSPILEKLPTRRGETTRWSNKGPFEQSVLQSSIAETRVDISRLIITLLAVNFLPAVALWRYNATVEWLQRHHGEIRSLSCCSLNIDCRAGVARSRPCDIRKRTTHLKRQCEGRWSICRFGEAAHPRLRWLG